MRAKQQIHTDKESIFIGALRKILKSIEKANMPQMIELIPDYTYESCNMAQILISLF